MRAPGQPAELRKCGAPAGGVIAVAIGGTQGALVGEDMLGPMFDAGYTVAGFYGQRRSAAGGVQWLQSA